MTTARKPRPLRIVVQARADAQAHPGGDMVLLHAMANVLSSRGHDVYITHEATPDLSDADLLLLFNLERTARAWAAARHAQNLGVPYAITPIYWDETSAVPLSAYAGLERWIRVLLPRRVVKWMALVRQRRLLRGAMVRVPLRSQISLQRDVLAGAAAVFPASLAERARLLAHFPRLDATRMTLARDGFEPLAPAARASGLPEAGFYLCAAAIGPRKNQHTLVEAFRTWPEARLLLVGDTGAGCEAYRRRLERRLTSNIEVRPGVDHATLQELYRRAAGVVQPSFLELPGLVALEAAALGRPVVVADVPPVREYYDGVATFADPHSAASLRAACEQVRAAPPAVTQAFRARHRWPVVLAPFVQAIEAAAQAGRATPPGPALAASRPARAQSTQRIRS